MNYSNITIIWLSALQVPTFTIWAEGMTPDAVIDIQPNGSIQGTLSTLTPAIMRSAKNNDDPAKGPVFPPSTSDADLQAAADAIREVLTVVDPGFAARNAPLATIDLSSPNRLHLHPRTKGSVACTRSRYARPLGRIRGKASHGVRITFQPHLKVARLSAKDAEAHRTQMSVNFLGIDLSWGDIWDGVKQGFNAIKEVLLDPIIDGVVKATINFIKNGIEYVWNGMVCF
jgi:hypothetical protein